MSEGQREIELNFKITPHFYTKVGDLLLTVLLIK